MNPPLVAPQQAAEASPERPAGSFSVPGMPRAAQQGAPRACTPITIHLNISTLALLGAVVVAGGTGFLWLWQAGLPGEVGLVAAGLAAVTLAVVAVVVLRKLPQFLRAINEPVSYTPVADRELPRDVAAFFDRHSAEMEALGYRRAADYRLKKHSQQYARVFLSADGLAFGELSHARQLPLLSMRGWSYMSMFDDGAYLECGSFPQAPRPRGGLFHVRVLPRGSIGAVHDLHRKTVAEIEAARSCRAVECLAEDFPVVSRHGLKLLFDQLVDERLVAVNPYAQAGSNG